MARRSLRKERTSKSKRTAKSSKSATRKATKTKKLSGGKRKKYTGRSKKVSNRKRRNIRRKHSKRKHNMSGGMKIYMNIERDFKIKGIITYIPIKDGQEMSDEVKPVKKISYHGSNAPAAIHMMRFKIVVKKEWFKNETVFDKRYQPNQEWTFTPGTPGTPGYNIHTVAYNDKNRKFKLEFQNVKDYDQFKKLYDDYLNIVQPAYKKHELDAFRNSSLNNQRL